MNGHPYTAIPTAIWHVVRGLPIALVVVLVWLVCADPLLAQSTGSVTLQGRVVDAKTDDPLADVHVFVAGSTIGTVTGDGGRYTLPNVPMGAATLHVSLLGYTSYTNDLILKQPGTRTIDVRLSPTVLESEGVTVMAERDRTWERRFETFTREFLGTTGVAESATITNPEVLRFDASSGPLTAEAVEPLIIESRALGYRIEYYLEEFVHTRGQTSYTGKPLFEPLTPDSPAQRQRWKDNRESTYRGSFRHFVRAALDGRAEGAGFTVTTAGGRRALDADDLFQPGPVPTVKRLLFGGQVAVSYREYLRSSMQLRSSDGALVDMQGYLANPYAVVFHGHWGTQRVADLLPNNYRPD